MSDYKFPTPSKQQQQSVEDLRRPAATQYTALQFLGHQPSALERWKFQDADSYDSAQGNSIYAGDAVQLKEINIEHALVREFRTTVRSVLGDKWTWSEENPVVHIVRREGDVAVHCVSQVLLPAIYVINKLLAEARGDKPPIAVTLRGQLPMPNDPTCTVDHALVIDSHQRIEPDPTILVLFEEKCIPHQFIRQALGSMASWNTSLKDLKDQPKKLQSKVDTAMYMQLPQLRKYIFGAKCVYALESDGETYIGMVWDRLNAWKSGMTLDQMPGIGGLINQNSHAPGIAHTARYFLTKIDGVAVQGPVKEYLSPREMVALYCYNALRDRGYL
ncbi:predicted protein [Postia placenta Mad-698-R]|nr:predicted protein [Postia placenta Mad-698-R]